MAIKKNIIKKVIGFLLLSPFLVYVINQILISSEELRSYQIHLELHWMIVGVSLLVVANSISCFLWHSVVCRLGVSMNFIDAFYIWNISRLGRFIPGSVWQFAGRMYLLKNFNKAIILWSMGIETAMELLSGFFCAGVGLFFLDKSVYLFSPNYFPYLIGVSLFLSFVLLHPNLMKRILSRILDASNELETPKFSEMLKWFIFYVGTWVIQITAFWVIIHGIGVKIGWGYFAAIFTISCLLGLIAPFAPGGIGVREGVMIFLLSPFLGTGFSSLVSILTRVFGLTGEGITVALSVLANLKTHKQWKKTEQ